MPAIYVCDLCGKHQPMEEQLTVVAREPDPEEWHFCEECSRGPHSADIGQGRRGKGGAGRLTHPLKLERCMLKSQTVIDLGPARSRFRERRSEAHYAEFAALRTREHSSQKCHSSGSGSRATTVNCSSIGWCLPQRSQT